MTSYVQPLRPNASTEEARAHEVAKKYISNLIIAAESNVTLNEHQMALRQVKALLEFEHVLTPPTVAQLKNMLALPAMKVAGLAHKSRCMDGHTRWVFDELEDVEDGDDAAPIEGVQRDGRSICPLVRTPTEVLDAALQLADVGPSDVVADLGCGDGRMLLRVARLGAHAVGFEVNEWCIRRSRRAAERARVGALVEVVDADLLQLDRHPRFTASTVVYVYLMPKVLRRERLQALLRTAVAAGKRVVIYCTSGASREPGNVLDGVEPAARAMGGVLRLYRQ